MSGSTTVAWVELAWPAESPPAIAARFVETPIDHELCKGWGFARPTVASLLEMFGDLNRRRHQGFIHGAINARGVTLRAVVDSEPSFWAETIARFVAYAAALGARGEGLLAHLVDYQDVTECRRLEVRGGQSREWRLAAEEGSSWIPEEGAEPSAVGQRISVLLDERFG